MAVQAEKNKSPSGSNNSDNRIESARHQPDSSAVQQTNNGGETVQMKRTLGVWNGIAIIIGVIVGSGIFISPKGVLVRAGSVGASLVVWGLCGLLALLGALCFAELGTSISSSGGEYTYINMAYGPMVSYLYIWVLVVIIMPCSNAISALSFATYCLQPLFEPGYKPPDEAIRLLALAILMLLIYINCVTVDGTLRLQSLFTLAKVLALGAIISYGLYYILAGNNFQSLYGPVVEPELASGNSSVVSVVGNSSRDEADVELEYKGWWFGTETNIFIMARAFYSGFYTYSGWNSLNAVTEEIRSPHKKMPRAIVLSITSVTLIYILANTAYFAVLTKKEMLNSDAIAVLFVGGLNGSIFAASRIYFAAAREGQLFNALAMINSRELTPIPSLVFLGLTSIAYLATTEIEYLIEYMTLIEATFAGLGVSTLLALRYQQPNLERPLKVPLVIPIVYLLITCGMIVFPINSSPKQAAIGIGITLTGLPAYYLTAKWKQKPATYQRLLDKMNMVIQKLTMSVMPSRDLQSP